MKVTKYSGELVHYDEQKLINSLRKSGADKAVAEAIVKKIESELYEGIASKEEVVDKIKQHSRNYAKRQITWFKKFNKEDRWIEL